MMFGWIHLEILAIGILSQSYEIKIVSYVDDIEVVALKRQIKYINQDIINLQNDQDMKDVDKEKLKLHQKNINNISSVFNEIQTNTTLYYSFDENIFLNINTNMKQLRGLIDALKDVRQDRKLDRLTHECIEEIKKGNYGSAVNKVYLIDDHSKVEKIINEVYKDKNNFNNVRNFGDEMPSISLSLVVYKSLLNEIKNDNYLYLDLIHSIKTQVLDQLAVDSITRMEAEDIFYKMKDPVGTWIADKLGIAVIHNRPDKELNGIIERIVYGIEDYKFFREIADKSVFKYYPKNTTNETYFLNVFQLNITDKQDIPLLIMYQSLLVQIYQNFNAYSRPELKLVLLQDEIKTSYEILKEKYKNIDQIFINTYGVGLLLTKMISHAILYEYYAEPSVDNLLLEMLQGDVILFIDVLRRSVDEIYGKKIKYKIVDMLSHTKNILTSSVGIVAVYDIIEKNNDLELKPKNFATLLKLESHIVRLLELPDMTNTPVPLVSLLKDVHDGVKHIKDNVSEIFNDGLLKDTYTTTYYKEISIQIFNSQTFGYMINNLADQHFDNFDTQKLVDYVLSFPKFEQRLVGLNVLQPKTYQNSVYLFEIAEIYKKMMSTTEYIQMDGIFKAENEESLKSLPISIRNAVFANEVYIKNLLDGGEYLYADDFCSDNQRDLYTRVSWKRGNNTKWAIENTRETGIYKIKNLQFNEYLYASEIQFDKNSRRVFLGNENGKGDKWRFIPIDDGLYIKNMLYKEYLFAGTYIKGEESRIIFTWMSGVENNRGGWKIEDATTDY